MATTVADIIQLSGVLFADLPSSPVVGMIAYIKDAKVTSGWVTEGGGNVQVLAWFAGNNDPGFWTVFAAY